VPVDFDAIAGALVTLFAATTAPSGEAALTKVTADLPDGPITQDRTILIFPPEEPEWMTGPSLHATNVQIPVRFYLWRLKDNPRNTKLLRKWATTLLPRIYTQVQLGLSDYVAWAGIDAGPTTGKLVYMGTDYYGVEFVVGVRVWEPLAAVA
jgi:hypothetical protein